ncbi:MAG: hypothetical protein M5U34_14305 [Chloroflexi bacterium]|nr:hypothetical protein [Chloroflexota bacterium]
MPWAAGYWVSGEDVGTAVASAPEAAILLNYPICMLPYFLQDKQLRGAGTLTIKTGQRIFMRRLACFSCIMLSPH